MGDGVGEVSVGSGFVACLVPHCSWYNGLANAGKINVPRAKEIEHRVIVYCKANQGKKVISAIDVVIKAYRREMGIKVKDEQ